jgi:hypothetical protein
MKMWIFFSAGGSIQAHMRAYRQLRKNCINLMQDWKQLQENYWSVMCSKWACLIYQYETEKTTTFTAT